MLDVRFSRYKAISHRNLSLTARDVECMHAINQTQNKAHRPAVRLFNATS